MIAMITLPFAIFAGSWGAPEILIILAIVLIVAAILKIAPKRNRGNKVKHLGDRDSVRSANNRDTISSDFSSHFCKNCGKQIQQDARYCAYCGHGII